MSEWVRSEKNKNFGWNKISINFTQFAYLLHCCLHMQGLFLTWNLNLGCLLAVSRVKYLYGIEFHGNPWTSMEIHGITRKSMEIHGNPWKSMEFHGWSIHGVPSNAMEFHGVSMGFHGMPWGYSMKYWWSSMECHEISCILLGGQWNSKEHRRVPWNAIMGLNECPKILMNQRALKAI